MRGRAFDIKPINDFCSMRELASARSRPQPRGAPKVRRRSVFEKYEMSVHNKVIA